MGASELPKELGLSVWEGAGVLDSTEEGLMDSMSGGGLEVHGEGVMDSIGVGVPEANAEGVMDSLGMGVPEAKGRRNASSKTLATLLQFIFEVEAFVRDTTEVCIVSFDYKCSSSMRESLQRFFSRESGLPISHCSSCNS